ncbi:unnamed protein product [Phaedon cochleariae]|uniref:Major facilitator superfamily (MFS) profile domain-containing protein n=1 Tax=Phaedon cochleariae TaxID=80249 RepID=A0A9P0GM06_PHACE|nr:unnamed protein product [Phaedon cochleariae]
MGVKCHVPVRLWIVVMVFLTTYSNYLTRVNIPMSIVSMRGGGANLKTKEVAQCLQDESSNKTTTNKTTALPDYGPRFDWSETVQGHILGSYFWGYCVGSLPGGVLADVLGSYKVIFWTCLLSAILNSLSVYAAHVHYALLMTCRFLIGLLAGPVYPAVQVLIAKWAPPAEKGKFVAGMMGNTLSTCITFPLVGAVTAAWGWDWGFHVLSIQILVFCVIFFFVASDTPDSHKFISQEEKDFIREAQGASVSKKKMQPPYLQIMKSVPFWILNILHFGNLYGLYVQITMVPKFMTQVIGFDLKGAGGLSALPSLARLFSGLGIGALGDYLKRKQVVSNLFIRKFFVLFSHIIPGLLMMALALIGCNSIMVIVLLVMSMAVNGAAVLTNLQNSQDLSPNFAGTIFGIISFCGGTAGFIVPPVTALFTGDTNGTTTEWGYTFIIGGGIYCLTGIIFIIFGSVKEQSWNKKGDEE